jgi:hypothetical protein
MRFGPTVRGTATAALMLVGGLTAWGGMGAASAGATAPSGTTCGGGATLASGRSLTVNGSFTITDDAEVLVTGVAMPTLNGTLSLTDSGFLAGVAQINGSISAIGAGFEFFPGTSIAGSVRVVNADEVTLAGATVGGSVTIQGTLGIFIPESSITGLLAVTNNSGLFAEIHDDTLGALTYSDNGNQSNPSGAEIGDDTINGPATCSDNTSAPNTGVLFPAGPSVVLGPTHGDQAATCTGVVGGS